MTKEEVLLGALALNGADKFSCTAHLNDDNTYVETSSAVSGGRGYGGRSASVSVSFSFSRNKNTGKVEMEKRSFSSADCKKVLRDYLDGCGYKKTNRGFFNKLFKSRKHY